MIKIAGRRSAKAEPTAAEKLNAAYQSDRAVRALSLFLFVLSTGFFSVVMSISYMYPGYFDRLLISQMADAQIDPIAVGSTAKAEDDDEETATVPALPVATLVRPWTLQPKDFSIVMVYGHEAHLASPGELWHVQVGSSVPGLGKIIAIEATKDGGIVKAENATLKGMPH
ncbi:hypothetical protein [Jiella sonneratiae]|uniref:Type II secretion system protein GspC N-terminal domain-containing protein n=1 Tax=Jiella sonneratiae TaxID=2816856 RepID=A0ABS3J1Q0_9HYPH|nr:hypothetical protein [Jiella sonneratiae]MBO0903598.1 hypothetical protein [Jiella sonneratiae]